MNIRLILVALLAALAISAVQYGRATEVIEESVG